MESITYRINLDVHRNGIQRTIEGLQTGDKMSRTIVISLTEGSKTYDLSLDNVTAAMYVTSPSGVLSVNACDITDGKISYTILDSDVATEGTVTMQLKVIGGESDAQKVLVCPQFAMDVWSSTVSDSEAEESSVFTALENALIEAKNYSEKAILHVTLDDDCTFTIEYADGTTYTSDAIKTVKETADGANTKSDNAVYQAKLANQTSDQAKSISQSAANQSVQAVNLAGSADTKSTQAIETANNSISTSTTALTLASTAESNSATAREWADKAFVNASEADTLAQKANYTSNEAMSVAKEAKKIAEGVMLSDFLTFTNTTTTTTSEGKGLLTSLKPNVEGTEGVGKIFDGVFAQGGYNDTTLDTTSNYYVYSLNAMACKENDVIQINWENPKDTTYMQMRCAFYKGNTIVKITTSDTTSTLSVIAPSGCDSFRFNVGHKKASGITIKPSYPQCEVTVNGKVATYIDTTDASGNTNRATIYHNGLYKIGDVADSIEVVDGKYKLCRRIDKDTMTVLSDVTYEDLDQEAFYTIKTYTDSTTISVADCNVELRVPTSEDGAIILDAYINDKLTELAKLENTVVSDAWQSTKSYAVGEYCLKDDTLYKCTVANVGQTPPNTSYWSATSICAELLALANKLS